ncbi:long-chain-fatty-acid--CoA ligase [Oceanicoccus sagamiensis]|uniref:Acyl-CoA synthetase n=1 Tax=Oceanicoccus sagamiensis TaxID=716816 RepID=A0A1X9NGP2_9GAMM|nr:long-chain-fatty-acid--CoA ligase [Oceanicoccus sagamiensis]ARN75562.1 hypothetical protein BST96_16480 [Oceanicoccus sagamiensis]
MFQCLHQFLDYHARVHGDSPFLVEGKVSLSFADFEARVDRAVDRLRLMSLSRGDRIALLGKNSINFFTMILACSKLGVVPVAVNYRLSPSEAAFIIADGTSQCLLIDAEFIDEVAEHCSGLPVIGLFGSHPAYPDFEQWLGDGEQAVSDSLPVIAASDILSQMYTSGTTGMPKGVLLSHANVIANVYQTAMASEYTFGLGEQMLLVAPMYHAAGIMTAYTGLIQGLTLIIHRDYSPERVVEALSSQPIVAATLVPAMLQFILNHVPDIHRQSFPSLQLIYYGASPMSVDLLKRAIEVFDCDFAQGYGQTEANSIVAMLSPSDHRYALASAPDLLSACGRATFDTRLRLVSEGKDVEQGEAGEIVASGPQVMQGYWNNPEATAATIKDGWLYTGDIGRMDKQGYLYIVGRVKDMIISGGENIYPAEIETVLARHQQINEVAVVGIPDARWGEVPLAVLVGNQSLDSDELRAFCADHLAKFKIPARFEWLGALPRNPSGKILKQQLREQFSN